MKHALLFLKCLLLLPTHDGRTWIQRFYKNTMRYQIGATQILKLTCSLSSRPEYHRCCSCEKSCIKYRTCCVDYLKSTDPFAPDDIDEYKSYLVEAALSSKATNCLPVSSLEDTDHLFLVDNCPKSHYGKRKKCEKGDIEPVKGSDGYIYKNNACAHCNHVKSYSLLNLHLYCQRKQQSMGNKVGHDTLKVNCRIIASEIDAGGKCNYISHLNMTNSKRNGDLSLCDSYMGLVNEQSATLVQRNIQCYNQQTPFPFLIVPACNATDDLNSQMYRDYVRIYKHKVVYSRNGLKLQDAKHVVCQQDELFDVFSGSCKQVSCSKGYKKVGRRCELDLDINNKPSQQKILQKCLMKQRSNITIVLKKSKEHKANKHMKLVANQLNVSISQIIIRGDLAKSIIQIYNISQQQSLKLFHKFQELDRLFWNISKKVVVGSLDAIDLSKAHYLDLRHAFPSHRKCAKPRALKSGTYYANVSCDIIASNVTYTINDYNIVYEQTSFLSNMTVYSCDGFYKALCEPIKYTELSQESLQVHPNMTLAALPSAQTFEYSAYNPTSYSAAICTTSSPLPAWKEIVFVVEEWMSLVMLSFSIISYLLVICHGCFIKEEKNLPTMNTACLCLALLASDVVYLAQTDTKGQSSWC